MPTERRWSDADRELVADALAMAGLHALPSARADAVLDALAAAGKLADPDHDARVRARVADAIVADLRATCKPSCADMQAHVAIVLEHRATTTPTTEETP